MINFEWYRSLIEVYRVGTVSAAQVLHLTQPAVSQHVAALESALGNPLFQRTPRRMVPTEAGQRLYTQVAGAQRETRISSAQKLHSRNSANHYNRYTARIFQCTNARSTTAGRFPTG